MKVVAGAGAAASVVEEVLGAVVVGATVVVGLSVELVVGATDVAQPSANSTMARNGGSKRIFFMTSTSGKGTS